MHIEPEGNLKQTSESVRLLFFCQQEMVYGEWDREFWPESLNYIVL